MKISPPDRIPLTNVQLQATDAFVSAGELVFEVSEVNNNHFAYTSDWNTPITNFTQQSIQDGHVYFIATTDQPPSFKVSVWNGRLHCTGCPIQAEVIAPESDTSFSGWWMILLTGFLFPALRWGAEKGLKYYFGSREEQSVDSQVTASALAPLWIGICGIITHQQYKNYTGAIGKVIDQVKVRLSDEKDEKPLRTVWTHLNLDDKRMV